MARKAVFRIAAGIPISAPCQERTFEDVNCLPKSRHPVWADSDHPLTCNTRRAATAYFGIEEL